LQAVPRRSATIVNGIDFKGLFQLTNGVTLTLSRLAFIAAPGDQASAGFVTVAQKAPINV
jgi:hypothetical protein